MQIRKAVILSLAAASLLTLKVQAQNSSINTFSPYTMYGIGDVTTPGPARFRSMGGVGVAFRDTHLDPYMASFNNLNPASYSAVPRNSFIFNVELEGENTYLKQGGAKTSYNTFNVRDIGIVFPVARNLGFGFSVSPYSSIGYRMEVREDDDDIVADIGDVRYKYTGEGDINHYRFGLGWQPIRNFSIGAELVYYHGYLDRQRQVNITPITSTGYSSTVAHMSEKISRIMMNAGFQYNFINNNKRMLTLGGTYQMGGKLNSRYQEYIPTDYAESGTVFDATKTSDLSLANTYTAGFYYQTSKIGLGLDYSFADWGSGNRKFSYPIAAGGTARYRNTNSVKAGFEITANRYDFRNYMKRISYRVGARYEDYYMNFDGKNIVDKAVTMGFGFPIKMGVPTFVNVGLEYGNRSGGPIKGNYFGFSIGLMLFGEDYWFVKQKYD